MASAITRSILGALVALGASLAGGATLQAGPLPFDLAEAKPYVAISFASRHIGGREDYVEDNPGAGLGLQLSPEGADTAFAIELGRYRNSRGKSSDYAVFLADRSIANISDIVDLRLGLMAGFARYPGAGDGFDRRGVPAIGDWALAAGVTGALRVWDRAELRIGAVPALDVADAVVTFQFRIVP
ncbi:MAG: hypothetical protein KJN93_09810 [Alphaproteobacteria bacterium]|nr:hypothetical protein [Alphaproteobacteria bacterium]NNF25276.1 hypothetical protein [Paracoccaceae bacterium]